MGIKIFGRKMFIATLLLHPVTKSLPLAMGQKYFDPRFHGLTQSLIKCCLFQKRTVISKKDINDV